MSRPRVAWSVVAVAAFTFCSSLALVAVAVAPVAKAEVQDNDTHAILAKADRIAAPLKGAACSERGWPHYEQQCLFDRTRANHEARSIRVIAIR